MNGWVALNRCSKQFVCSRGGKNKVNKKKQSFSLLIFGDFTKMVIIVIVFTAKMCIISDCCCWLFVLKSRFLRLRMRNENKSQ